MPLPVEGGVAALLCIASFAAAGAAFTLLDSQLAAALIGLLYLAGVIAVARLVSIAYAVPLAMVGFLAYDWFYLEPTHPYEIPDAANLVDLIVYIAVAVLIGELAGSATRRAERSERERGAIADEQAALRRVATLVAKGAPADEVFAVVTREVGLLLAVDVMRMGRYEPDGTMTTVASWSRAGGEVNTRASVGAPIVVDQELWGVMFASSRKARLPVDTAARIAAFNELVATALSNIQGRSELAASRARVVAAAHNERRRVVRDLHDGAQQRLVHTVVTLKLAERALANDGHGRQEGLALLGEAVGEADLAILELRQLAHGILPSVLTRGGLRAGVEGLAARMTVPADVGVTVARLPEAVEATAYFVVAEALTNVAKHARAGHVAIEASVQDHTLHVSVRDDGVGGARPDGTGLTGLAERLATHDGRLHVLSPSGGGTLVAATIPLEDQPG